MKDDDGRRSINSKAGELLTGDHLGPLPYNDCLTWEQKALKLNPSKQSLIPESSPDIIFWPRTRAKLEQIKQLIAVLDVFSGLDGNSQP